MHQISPADAELYARLTLRQWGFPEVTVQWKKQKRFLGAANIRQRVMLLHPVLLQSRALFELVVKHETAHFMQFRDNGNRLFKKNGRWSLHGQDFKIQCKKLGIPAKARINLAQYNVTMPA